MFPGFAVLCVADLAIIQIQRVYVPAGSFSELKCCVRLLSSGPRVSTGGTSTILKLKEMESASSAAATKILTILKALQDSRDLQIMQ